MLSYEYRQFLNEKVHQFLPQQQWHHGTKINFKCPICGDGKTGRKHRAWWFDDTASFYCWNQCGGMSGIKFLEFISGESYDDIRRDYLKLFAKNHDSFSLSADYDLPTDEPSLFQLQPLVKPEWKQPLSDAAKAYIHSRKVDEAPFFRDSLYSWNSQKSGLEYILIPWTLNGVAAYYQLNDFQRHGALKYIFPKDKKKLIYGLDNIDISWPYIIAFEGVYDSVFVKNGIAVGTKAITEYQMKLIKERFPKHQVVVSFDNDIPGMRAMTKLVEQNSNLKFFRWYDEDTTAKDVNEFVLQKNDVNIFSDPAKLEKMIFSSLVMKMWMISNRKWLK